ncbi:class I SAM-dependent methyltransferase [bacterium]|nr:MAG: class I SAM-dependent methyltransferase [bacterium]
MSCSCQCQGIEELFDERSVAKDVEGYRRNGPDSTTRWLINALSAAGVQGLSLLDIGGGVGAIQNELLAAGVQSASYVEASTCYLQAAREEAQRRGLAQRVTFWHGNFAELAPQLAPAGVVTLDRVICCYDDWEKLLRAAAEHAESYLGLVYPRDTWWTHAEAAAENIAYRLMHSHFHFYIHPARDVDALLRQQGLRRSFFRQNWYWQVAVYAR